MDKKAFTSFFNAHLSSYNSDKEKIIEIYLTSARLLDFNRNLLKKFGRETLKSIYCQGIGDYKDKLFMNKE